MPILSTLPKACTVQPMRLIGTLTLLAGIVFLLHGPFDAFVYWLL